MTRLHTRKRPARRNWNVRAPTPRQIRGQLKRLENWINDLKMIPATQVYRSKVVLPMFSKALTVGGAICVLVDEGFPAEAFGLSRTLADMYFCVRYISNKDTDARMTTFVEYWARVHQEWGSIVAKHFSTSKVTLPLWHDEVMQIAKKFASKHNWTGHGGQVKCRSADEFLVPFAHRIQTFAMGNNRNRDIFRADKILARDTPAVPSSDQRSCLGREHSWMVYSCILFHIRCESAFSSPGSSSFDSSTMMALTQIAPSLRCVRL